MFKSITDPLVHVAEAMQTFIAEPELRLLHVTTSDPIRIAALEHIAAAEHHQENLCPFVFLEAPTETTDDGWSLRSEELRADMEELAELHEKAGEGVTIRPMPAEARAPSTLGRFGLELRAAVDSLGSPLEGLVVVLSPVWVRDPKQWMEDVAALVERPELARVRWVIVDLDESICRSIAERRGDLALVVDARLDTREVQRDVEAMLSAAASAPPGADGMRMAGMAGPDEVPPPHKVRTPPLTSQQARVIAEATEKARSDAIEKGIPEPLLRPEPMRELRGFVIGAAGAMIKGDASRAVALMREAKALCRGAGLGKLAVMMGLVMGGFAMQARAPDTAAAIFREARAEADAAKLPALSAQAQLAVGSGLLAAGKSGEAALAFAEAGQLAAGQGERMFAIEAYRMAGQVLVSQRDIEHAAGAFWRAVQIASDGEPEEWRLSSGPEAARALGRIFREHGSTDRADWLERVAVEMETMGESEADTPSMEGDDACCDAV
ncbi:hypothetical protein [Polyangium jinanense]|uniref:Uncharacterized protein n=1 Tax=Polyangium jinanense TaxID=2829994 RepID=A0A9X3X8K1_9BACT|nr:hypothetical protein [Polyangium jinanense]MDC3960693.1 hypothetical protein [Polyangium jinanense]MDC3984525.1 hypothetical protein [Polyangium jinanense]